MTASADDDAALVAAVAAAGDERAFDTLYDRHTPYLWRLALRLAAGDESAAREMVHEAWVRAVPKFASFRFRSALRTWLAGYVVNVARELARDGGELPLDDAIAANDADAELVAAARLDLERALDRLPPGFRQVLVLHDVEGFTHDEIAGMLGVAAGTSKSQLARARRRLRSLLEGDVR